MPRGEREAVVRVGIDDRRLDGTLTTARRKMSRWGRHVATDLSSSMRGAFDGLSSIAGLGGLAAVSVAAKGVLDFERRMVRLQIAARLAAGQIAVLRSSIFAAATQRGVDPDEILGGVEKYIALTGRVDEAMQAVRTFTLVAAASGATSEDVAATAAALTTNLGISADQMERAFSVLVTQGKNGAVELRELATLAAGLTPRFQQFGGSGVEALAEMGALLQVMRGGFGSSAEAATGFNALMASILKNEKKLRALGVKLFDVDPDGTRRMRHLTDIVFALGDKTRGDAIQIQNVLGDKEAISAAIQLLRAGRAEVEELIRAGLQSNELQKDAATWQESAAGKIAKTQAQLKKTFNEALLDKLDLIADAFQRIADVVGWLVEHPMAALAGYLGLKILPGTLGAIFGGGGGGGGVGQVAGTAARLLGGGGGAGGLGSGSLLGPGLLVAAAGAAGYALGTFADQTLRLSDRLAGIDVSLDTQLRFLEQNKAVGGMTDESLEIRKRIAAGFYDKPGSVVTREQALRKAEALEREARETALREARRRVEARGDALAEVRTRPQRFQEAAYLAAAMGMNPDQIRQIEKAGTWREQEEFIRSFPTTGTDPTTGTYGLDVRAFQEVRAEREAERKRLLGAQRFKEAFEIPSYVEDYISRRDLESGGGVLTVRIKVEDGHIVGAVDDDRHLRRE